MNKLWHEQNKMPPRATLDQRIRWHQEHQKYCACRKAPKSLQELIKEKTARYSGSRIGIP
jgi:hypothetical protein